MDFIDLKSQQKKILPKIKKRFDSILSSGTYIMGKEVNELEERLADYCGVKHAITCSSGTDALIIPLMAMGIGPGDAVFTTPFTYVATAEVISILGATPVFVDVYDSTFNIDCDKLEIEVNKVIKDGNLIPKAIIPVDLFGVPARYRLINQIAKKYNLKVIADGAQSFGASINGKKVGVFGDIAATSFYPAKPLGCYGDGGAIFTDNDDLSEKCKAIRIHGTKKDKYNSSYIGLNGRLDTFQAAVLLEKLSIFDGELESRENISTFYRKNFHNAQYIPKNYCSSHALFSIILKSKEERKKIMEKLNSENIPSVIYYKNPIHLMPAYSYLNYSKGDLPVSETLSNKIISLPMHPYLSSSDLKKIVEVFRN